MTKLDFPDTPSTGQQYGSSGTVWRWDGTRWGSTAGAAGAKGVVAYAQVTTPTTGITAQVAIAGLSATWTADPSRTYRITARGTIATNTSLDFGIMYIAIPGVGTLSNHGQTLMTATAGETYFVSAVQSGLSGSQTRNVTVARVLGGGTLTFHAAADSVGYIMVEDITYEAGSTPGAGNSNVIRSMPRLGTTQTIAGGATGNVIAWDFPAPGPGQGALVTAMVCIGQNPPGMFDLFHNVGGYSAFVQTNGGNGLISHATIPILPGAGLIQYRCSVNAWGGQAVSATVQSTLSCTYMPMIVA